MKYEITKLNSKKMEKYPLYEEKRSVDFIPTFDMYF